MEAEHKMESEKHKALKSWTDGGLEVGFDYGKALTLIYVTGLLNGLRNLLPQTPAHKEGENESARRVAIIHWKGGMNLPQKIIYAFCRFLEKVFLGPLTRLGERVIGPACGYIFAAIALLPGYYKGTRSNILLRHKQYQWAMNFVEKHSGKVVWGTIALSVLGFFMGIFLPFILSSKIALAAYFVSMVFLPLVLSSCFLGCVAAGYGLWHILSPLIPFTRSDKDRVFYTYRAAHKVEAAFEDQPEVVKRLNGFFKGQINQLEEYTNQDALLIGRQSRAEKRKSGVPTIAQLQKEQEAFIAKLQKMKPQDRLNAIGTEEHRKKMSWG